MKIHISFKTPDAVEESVRDDAESIEDEDEREDFVQEVKDLASKWVEYGECVTLELDTETKTIKVCEVS